MISLKLLLFEALDLSDAIKIFKDFGVDNAHKLSKEELKKKYIELIKTYHPDKKSKTADDIKTRNINAAYDVLKLAQGNHNIYSKEFWDKKGPGFSSSNYSYSDYTQRQNRTHRQSDDSRHDYNQSEPWAWAGWDGGLPPNDQIFSASDINYLKKQAWEISGKPKPSKENEYSIMDWDGFYFRCSFSVYAIPSELFKISEMMVKWDNHYRSAAVFYQKKTDTKTIYLINLGGKKVDTVQNPSYSPGTPFQHNSFNGNPNNDKEFLQYLRKHYPPANQK